MSYLTEYKYKYIWITLGVITLIVNQISMGFPEAVDAIYFRGIYQGLRWTYDHLLGWIPIPMIYLFNVGFIVIVGRIFTKMINNFKSQKIKKGLHDVALNLLAVAGGVIFLFYMLWGFNYNRSTIYAQLNMQPQEIDKNHLISEIDRVVEDLKVLRSQVTNLDSVPITADLVPADLEVEIRRHLEDLLTEWEMPTYGKVRIRKLAPKGILLRFSTAGVYVPFAFEGHIDKGLHPIQWPFTMAHEMAHGYGYGDEGACNFIGYLACLRSDNAAIRYSAQRAYWRYLMTDLKKIDSDLYADYWRALPVGVQADIRDIIKYMNRYPDLMPDVRNKVYDSYLKSHGVKAGLANYSHMIKYVKAYENRNNNKESN